MADNGLKCPIYGGINTKRGAYYRYKISSDHRVDVWKNVRIKTPAPKEYKERNSA